MITYSANENDSMSSYAGLLLILHFWDNIRIEILGYLGIIIGSLVVVHKGAIGKHFGLLSARIIQ